MMNSIHFSFKLIVLRYDFDNFYKKLTRGYKVGFNKIGVQYDNHISNHINKNQQ